MTDYDHCPKCFANLEDADDDFHCERCSMKSCPTCMTKCKKCSDSLCCRCNLNSPGVLCSNCRPNLSRNKCQYEFFRGINTGTTCKLPVVSDGYCQGCLTRPDVKIYLDKLKSL